MRVSACALVMATAFGLASPRAALANTELPVRGVLVGQCTDSADSSYTRTPRLSWESGQVLVEGQNNVNLDESGSASGSYSGSSKTTVNETNNTYEKTTYTFIGGQLSSSITQSQTSPHPNTTTGTNTTTHSERYSETNSADIDGTLTNKGGYYVNVWYLNTMTNHAANTTQYCSFIVSGVGNLGIADAAVADFSLFDVDGYNHSLYWPAASSFTSDVISSHVYLVQTNGNVIPVSQAGGTATIVSRKYFRTDGVGGWHKLDDNVGYAYFGSELADQPRIAGLTIEITGCNQTYTIVALDSEFFRFRGTTDAPAIVPILDDMRSTDGAGGIVGDAVNDAGEFQDAVGVGDALNIASGGFGAMLGQEGNSTLHFDGIELGAEFGGFSIPAFDVDVWQFVPEGVQPLIKTGFTAVCVFSWAVGMKKFFDRIFHGEQVVSTD